MLVLSRKVNQKIVIGSEIVVTVLSVKGNRVSIGIEAPRRMGVVRQELLVDESEAWSGPVLDTPVAEEAAPLVPRAALPPR